MSNCRNQSCKHWELAIQKHKDAQEPLRKFLGKLYDGEMATRKSQDVAASFVLGTVLIAVLAVLVFFCYTPMKGRILAHSVLSKRGDCEVSSRQEERPSTSTSTSGV